MASGSDSGSGRKRPGPRFRTDRNRTPPGVRPHADLRRRDGFVPLETYAPIGDGRTVGLVALDGSIDWLALPELDTAPVFSAILDPEHGGSISLHPSEPATVRRHYEDDSNVLVTEWTTDSGMCRVTDAMLTGTAGRLPWAQLARVVHGVEGEVAMTWEVVPGRALGSCVPERRETANGTVLVCDSVTLGVSEQGFGSVARDDVGFGGGFTTGAGTEHVLTVVGTDGEPLLIPDPADVPGQLDVTRANWDRWSSAIDYDGPWDAQVRRSALALKLLIHAPSGAIAAAATTSLPEDRRGGKNWDYRFAWVRDLAYTVRAISSLGFREEAHAAVSWLLRTIRQHEDDMPIFYTLQGDKSDGVTESDAPGWNGIGPVTVGNHAVSQLQLGVWGDVLDVMAQYVAQGNQLDPATAGLLERLADSACRQWPKKDSAMWELDDEQHYTSGKLGCWQALDRAIELHDAGQIAGDRETWAKNRRLIEQWVDENGWNEERGAYVMRPGTSALDTAVLLHTMSGFDRGPRMSATIDAIVSELERDGLVFRYSGVAEEEGAFVACSFWLVTALAQVGRIDEARSLMEKAVAHANDVGVYSEMISVDDGSFLGNLPQALSHLALVQAALAIRDAERA
ncbi:glycoside hydrolase family 15 protein [Frondihabitans australicus]|uniref:GH15 family glucan-1,4-alpha-glucosidase n=1 Tax=Frondihabitans australicus TaxID=386892 RepID=A0A495IBV2_9MICO|nr:glycoside hydrolase family 15 protein [Frondihabitans australicus]RKR73399.1 GH15 family glucan-1,4-alpha-glucosidase [Frondihabitans australicus]